MALVAAAAFSAIMAFAAVPAAAAGANLLNNPDFSRVDEKTGLPADYTYDIHSGDVEFAADGKVFRSGDFSVRIDGWTPNARARVWQRVSAPSFKPGATYKVIAWYRTDFIDDPASVAIRVRFGGADYRLTDDMVLSANGKWTVVEGIHFQFYAPELAENEWKSIEATFRAPEGVTNMPVEFFLITVDGTVWWDDVHLEIVE